MKIDTEKMFEEILKSQKFKDILLEALATKVFNEYHYKDSEGDMIRNDIRDIIHEEADDIIEDLSKNYYEINLKKKVEEELSYLTKRDLLEIKAKRK